MPFLGNAAKAVLENLSILQKKNYPVERDPGVKTKVLLLVSQKRETN